MNSMIKHLGLTTALAVCAIAFVPLAVVAQIEIENPMESNVEHRNRCSEAAEQYWTPERIRNAQPLPLPTPETEPVPQSELDSEQSNPSAATGEASPPSQMGEDRQQQ